jgi:hypothetical protein
MIKLIEFVGTLLGRILIPIFVVFGIYKLIAILARKINIKEYTYFGSDYLGGEVKITLFNANDSKNEYYNRKKVNIDNNKFYFKVWVKTFKSGMSADLPINENNPASFDVSLIVLVNKDEISFMNRLKFLMWFVKELLLNKLTDKRDKVLPYYIVNPYVLSNDFMLNIDKFITK